MLLIITGLAFCFAAGAQPPPAANARRCADSWLGRDKLAHFAVSLAGTGYGYHLARREQHRSPARSRNIAIGITLSAGLVKEFRDGFSTGNHFCLRDLAADAAGIALGTALFARR